MGLGSTTPREELPINSNPLNKNYLSSKGVPIRIAAGAEELGSMIEGSPEEFPHATETRKELIGLVADEMLVPVWERVVRFNIPEFLVPEFLLEVFTSPKVVPPNRPKPGEELDNFRYAAVNEYHEYLAEVADTSTNLQELLKCVEGTWLDLSPATTERIQELRAHLRDQLQELIDLPKQVREHLQSSPEAGYDLNIPDQWPLIVGSKGKRGKHTIYVCEVERRLHTFSAKYSGCDMVNFKDAEDGSGPILRAAEYSSLVKSRLGMEMTIRQINHALNEIRAVLPA